MHTPMEHTSDTRCKVSELSDAILMCLVSASDPLKAIVRHYDEAEDKELFVHALAGTLILRHRQWQAKGNATQGL
ncbi:MAG: hypothetical protein J1E80_07895 [Desulfovibrionaceae bacterium]|nr:hypothetical protein [Desulfovibrionaceae bacterium]